MPKSIQYPHKPDEVVLPSTIEIQRELARRKLLNFTSYTFNDTDQQFSTQKYSYNWFHETVCEALDQFLLDVEAMKSPRLMIFAPPRHGKQIADNTPILTIQGWKTHGDLTINDQVFSPTGKPVSILSVSEKTVSDYVVTFNNGDSIRCHGNHEWAVSDRHDENYKVHDTKWFLSDTKFGKQRKLDNGQIGTRGGRYTYQIPRVGILQFPAKDLIMDPYVLGVWLGDGSKGKGVITHDKNDMAVIDKIKDRGYIQSAQWVHKTTGVITTSFSGPRPGVAGRMLKELRALKVCTDKYIPDEYIFSSIDQRLSLLAGLMDTDGHCDDNSRCRFTTADEKLKDTVFLLCQTLGFNPYVQEVEPALSSSGIQGKKLYYVVGFQPTVVIPCVLKRKLIGRIVKPRRISIKSVEYYPNGEQGHCIQVDSEDGLYVVGKSLIVTHNSEMVSRRFPAYAVGKYPHYNFITSSYNADLAEEMCKNVQEIMETPEYRNVFPGVRIKSTVGEMNRRKRQPTQNTSKFDIMNADGEKQGVYNATGVASGATGKGAHIFIIDDPVKDEVEATSETTRRRVDGWFKSVALTRLAPGGGFLIIMTRWHDDDLAGRILKGIADGGEPWQVINCQAIAEEDEYYRNAGEALHPERYSVERLRRIQKDVGPRVWSSLYQQHPTMQRGGLFQRAFFEIVDIVPERIVKSVRYWDRAATLPHKGNPDPDYTAGFRIDKGASGKLYLVDLQHTRNSPSKIDDLLLATAKGDGKKTEIHISEDPGQAGKGQTTNHKKLLRGYRLKFIRETGSKELRAEGVAVDCENGNVVVLRRNWNETFFSEVEGFPFMPHDDIVDSLSGAWTGITGGLYSLRALVEGADYGTDSTK